MVKNDMRLATTIRTASTALGLVGVLASLTVAVPAWAAAGTTATVYTGGGALNVRSGAATSYPRIRTLGNGTAVTLTCQQTGQWISGNARSTSTWDGVSGGGYVSDAYIRWSPSRPTLASCSGSAIPVQPPPQLGSAKATVNGGASMNVRSGPSTLYPVIRTVADHSTLTVTCQRYGEPVKGNVSSTDLWDGIAGVGFASDSNISWQPSRPSSLPTCGISASAVPTVPSTQSQFISSVSGMAQQTARQFNVPASVTLAQAILESGWGQSALSANDHNFFGIKCFGNPGPVAISCHDYKTTECDKTKCWPTTASFRVYRTVADSVTDHGRFLAIDNSRYQPCFAYADDPDGFADQLQAAGYATSPTYAQHLKELMGEYNLYRFV